MEIPLLNDIVIIFGVSIVILLICHRLRVPSVVGFLLAGILAGPYGLGLVKAVHEVEILAEIGVVLLLFTIGIEFSLQRLLQIKKSVLMGGVDSGVADIFFCFSYSKATGPTRWQLDLYRISYIPQQHGHCSETTPGKSRS
jgi:Kef-type K+ transport system membrane component KefB